MSGNLRSTILIILIVAAILGSAVIWYRFFTSRPVEPVTGVSFNNMAVGSQSLLTLLESLEGLKFDLGILDNPLYKSLQDFTPNIQAPELRGRANPFAPL
ncbi:MAG: hypothetical protein HYY55_04240 [Candidatus Niyogibacteria bacterium]|nr:MAG: hypothetical protein HYY55_04240 [Candidatus Niyogibacteria bacterium]